MFENQIDATMGNQQPSSCPKGGEGSTARIDHLSFYNMVMKSVGNNPEAPGIPLG